MSLPPDESLAEQVRRVWPAARARWSAFVLLGEPVLGEGLPAVAQIDLGTRVVAVDGPTLQRLGLRPQLEAILAHEVGHHVSYPATLATQARLRLLERGLIPFPGFSLLNSFTDLLINERLGHALSDDLAAVYRAFTADLVWKRDPSFLFYLAVYEELWRLPQGSLQGRHAEDFHREFPAHRADAQLLAQDLFGLGPNLYAQYLFFASVLVRYLQPLEGTEPKGIGPGQCATGEPSPEDWADALTPGAPEEEALERALREGWLTKKDADRLRGQRSLERRLGGLPGHQTGDLVQVTGVMAAYYRQQAERLLFRPPRVRRLGEAVVPTTTAPWEPGDPVSAIDWRATLAAFGPELGPAAPVVREQVSDPEGLEVSTWQPRMELYLDTSGSMPNPIEAVNAMTLAAVVLAVAAVRAGGEVRALVYSVGTTKLWDWCRSEQQLTSFLMHYIGGGTEFPFDVLDQSLDACRARQPVRVAITDQDFDGNIDAKPGHPVVFARGGHASGARAAPAPPAGGARATLPEGWSGGGPGGGPRRFPEDGRPRRRRPLPPGGSPMSVIDRLLGRGNRSRAQVSLATLVPCAGRLAAWWEHRAVEPALVRARLADRCRDAGVTPLEPARFDAAVKPLDDEGWRRLAVLTGLLDEPGALAVFAAVGPSQGAETLVHSAWVGLAREKNLLTMKLLRGAPLRAEELTRAWASRLGAVIDGESVEVSRQALERLDYARLLEEAERARQLAAARLEYLQKAQTEEDRRRAPRRGKW